MPDDRAKLAEQGHGAQSDVLVDAESGLMDLAQEAHHFAASVDLYFGFVALYVDGIEIPSSVLGEIPPTLYDSAGPLYLGGGTWFDRYGSPQEADLCGGAIGDVKIWQVYRSEEDVCLDAYGEYDAVARSCTLPDPWW